MAEWLRLPSGQAVNMDRVSHVVSVGSPTEEQLLLYAADQHDLKLTGTDASAVHAYLERVHVGERTADERPPRGRDHVITRW